MAALLSACKLNLPMFKSRHRFAVLLLAAALGQGQAMARVDATPANAPDIQVQRHAGKELEDVSLFVNATPQQAWEVLTDYDHLADFFPNLQSIKLIGHEYCKTKIEEF